MRGLKYQYFLRDDSLKSCFVSNDCPVINYLGKVTVLKRGKDRLLLSANVDVVESMKVYCVGDEGEITSFDWVFHTSTHLARVFIMD